MTKFGPVSHSEIIFFFTRACVGAGASYGVGEEIAKAANWLADRGYDPAKAILPALENINAGIGAKVTMAGVKQGNATIGPANGQALSACYGAIAASDQLCGQMTNSINLLKIDCPMLAAAIIKNMSLTNLHVSALDGDPIKDKMIVAPEGGIDLSVVVDDSTPAGVVPSNEEIMIDQDAWDGIIAYFKKCLVPATEESRLSGAGAGLVDTD